MILIGLLWMTSWFGGVFALYESLSPTWMVKVDPTKATTSFSELISQKRKFRSSSYQRANVWQLSLIPVIQWQLNWSNKVIKSNAYQTLNLTIASFGETKTKFCTTVPENKVAQSTPKNSTYFLPISFNQSSLTKVDFSPHRFWRSLKGFLHTINTQGGQSSNNLTANVSVIKRHTYQYEVWVNQRLIASLPDQITANLLQQRLSQLIDSPNLDPTKLRPAMVDHTPSLMVGNRFLFGVDEQIANQLERSSDVLAIEWANNLRLALQTRPLTLLEAQMEMYGLQHSETTLSGVASWYGDYFHGRLTANGEIYNQNELTVAHRSLPFNTYLQVTNLQNGKSVIVRVNDRGPYISPRTLDLSREAARCLGGEITGVIPYEAVILRPTAPTKTLNPETLVKEPTDRGVVLVSNFK
ncbi:MAG TPA: septal ring lytic transglycosylase RlpA family protein [Nostocaceae cyanobacterium]|nr:septal ring lytic transglycosylase RlpA family protein [Nostocaceae cyanobacterium]